MEWEQNRAAKAQTPLMSGNSALLQTALTMSADNRGHRGEKLEHVVYVVNKIILRLDILRRPSPSFLRLAGTIPPQDLVVCFGTHYRCEVHMGGEMVCKHTEEESQGCKTGTVAIGWPSGPKGQQAGISGMVNDMDQGTRRAEIVHTRGGTWCGSIREWVQTVHHQRVVVKQRLRPLWELLHQGVAQEQLRRYIQDMQMSRKPRIWKEVITHHDEQEQRSTAPSRQEAAHPQFMSHVLKGDNLNCLIEKVRVYHSQTPGPKPGRNAAYEIHDVNLCSGMEAYADFLRTVLSNCDDDTVLSRESSIQSSFQSGGQLHGVVTRVGGHEEDRGGGDACPKALNVWTFGVFNKSLGRPRPRLDCTEYTLEKCDHIVRFDLFTTTTNRKENLVGVKFSTKWGMQVLVGSSTGYHRWYQAPSGYAIVRVEIDWVRQRKSISGNSKPILYVLKINVFVSDQYGDDQKFGRGREIFDFDEGGSLSGQVTVMKSAPFDQLKQAAARIWLLQLINGVLMQNKDVSTAKMVLLKGGGGSGKTAMLAQLVLQSKAKLPGVPSDYLRIVGYHFCSANDRTTLRSGSMVFNLMRILRKNLPLYVWDETMWTWTLQKCQDQPHQAFKDTVIRMLNRTGPTREPLVIVIDSIDEASLVGGEKSIWEVLVQGFKDLPPWCCVLGAFRSSMEREIEHRLRNLVQPCVVCIDVCREENVRDVEEYVTMRASEFCARNPTVR
ncbi:hypothetical protein CBR_g39545 [Chara braunii]|nr:hypothetical protein CBR_g39545 [Chara braunii]|eukprot:GBG85082.1 hypothetical protein CBR_g39545 [Chara braunii]